MTKPTKAPYKYVCVVRCKVWCGVCEVAKKKIVCVVSEVPESGVCEVKNKESVREVLWCGRESGAMRKWQQQIY